MLGKSKIRMIKHIEKLRFHPQLGALRQGEILGKVESHSKRNQGRAGRCGQGFRTGRSGGVSPPLQAPVLGSTAESKGIGIEPLDGAGLSDSGNGLVLIEGTPGNEAGELRATALHNTISIGGVRRAQHGERIPAVPKGGSRNLPPVQRIPEPVTMDFNRQLVDVLTH